MPWGSMPWGSMPPVHHPTDHPPQAKDAIISIIRSPRAMLCSEFWTSSTPLRDWPGLSSTRPTVVRSGNGGKKRAGGRDASALGRYMSPPSSLSYLRHCTSVSQWGHDFRPDYKGLGPFKQRYPQVVLECRLRARPLPLINTYPALIKTAPIPLSLSDRCL